MEDDKKQTIPITDNQANSSELRNTQIKKDPKAMSSDEQLIYFKDQFQKTRKLFLHYEKESKLLENKVKSLSEKLNKYEPKQIS